MGGAEASDRSRPAAVNCPTDAKQGKRNDVQGAANVEGQAVTVNVTQTDDSGHVTFATADAMLHRTDVATRPLTTPSFDGPMV